MIDVKADLPSVTAKNWEIMILEDAICHLNTNPNASRKKLKKVKKQLLCLRSLDRAFGVVFASSGHARRTSIGGIMHWALIEVREDVKSPNQV